MRNYWKIAAITLLAGLGLAGRMEADFMAKALSGKGNVVMLRGPAGTSWAQTRGDSFRQRMKELAPVVWLTALRKVQNPNRAGLDIVVDDTNFNSLKVSPVFHWTDADMDKYLEQHNLPIEWDYFDPAKADEKRECGLHASWGGKAVKEGSGV